MRCLQLRALGPRADVVVVQTHPKVLELLQLHQGGSQALSAGRAWEALDAANGAARPTRQGVVPGGNHFLNG